VAPHKPKVGEVLGDAKRSQREPPSRLGQCE
jgi:hypothetical protein